MAQTREKWCELNEEGTRKMLQCLDILEKVAANKANCSNPQDAKKLVDAAVKPIYR
jgi:hypothetical protein